MLRLGAGLGGGRLALLGLLFLLFLLRSLLRAAARVCGVNGFLLFFALGGGRRGGAAAKKRKNTRRLHLDRACGPRCPTPLRGAAARGEMKKKKKTSIRGSGK